MKKILLSVFFVLFTLSISAQKIKFEEYNLDNGLHVILHKDNSAPVVAVSVSYHVGAINEDSTKIGFTSYFERLLWNNVNNTDSIYVNNFSANNNVYNDSFINDPFVDRTYFANVMVSNKLKECLWMESERMMPAKIDTSGMEIKTKIGADTTLIETTNLGYTLFNAEVNKLLFKNHPYGFVSDVPISKISNLKLNKFVDFYNTYYVPNNAVLTIAGDFDSAEAKLWIAEYFDGIKSGKKLKKTKVSKTKGKKPFGVEEITDTIYDANINIPAIVVAYRTPKLTDKDAYVVSFIQNFLLKGTDSKMYKNIVEEEKLALQLSSFLVSGEDYGSLTFFALKNNGVEIEKLLKAIDFNIDEIKNKNIELKEYDKELNKIELMFVSKHRLMNTIAESLSNSYLFYGNTDEVNSEIKKYRAVKVEDIKRVSRKYFNKNNRVVLYYFPVMH